MIVSHDKRVFLIGGPGGVGKTTLAASLGIRLAMSGYRTVVLTVDPARRLAQALGLENFKTDLQAVPLPQTGTPGKRGELFASMLDTQRYFDRVIERFARDSAQQDRILNNPLYRITVDNLGGSHEYAAMERLLEFAQDESWDKVVVDTPPTQNALDLLSAPQRMADFMDNSVLRWFQSGSPKYLQLFRTGTKVAMKLIQKIFGADFMQTFAGFMDDLEGMHGGFRTRNLEVLELLKHPATAFLLVTFPSEVRFTESVSFVDELRNRAIPLAGLILNRVEAEVPKALVASGEVTPEDRHRVSTILSYYRAIYENHNVWVEKFQTQFAPVPLVTIPRQDGLVHDVPSLSKLGGFLVE